MCEEAIWLPARESNPSNPTTKGSGVFKINVFGSLVIAGIAYLTA